MGLMKHLSTVGLLLIIQGCSGGGGGDSSNTSTDPSSDPGGSQNPPVISSKPIPISDCTDGMTPFQSGDEINKTVASTEIEMIYGEDGSQSGCVVTGAAEIERNS